MIGNTVLQTVQPCVNNPKNKYIFEMRDAAGQKSRHKVAFHRKS